MENFIEIRLKPKSLAMYGLPDIAYPLPINRLADALVDDGKMPFAEMLFGLQQRSRDGEADWQALEPAMERLAQLIAPRDAREVISVAGDHWWLEIGPVDLNAKLVTIQRGSHLIAAIVNSGDGRLRASVFRPLDAKSAGYLIAASQTPHPTHGVCMRENNWEYLLDNSAGFGQYYAADRGEAYLSYWEKGLGILHDDTIEPTWRAMKDLPPRPAVLPAMELGLHYSFSREEEEEPDNPDMKTEQVKVETFPMWRPKRQQQRTIQGRFAGCLLGGAVGDALGAPVEFMRRTEIIKRFGPKGITNYAPAYGGLGTITDDTQMTLFTAEGLLRAYVRHACKGITTVSGVVAHAYLRWLLTQGERPVQGVLDKDEADGWLFQQSALHNRRAPGNTCLSALRAMDSFGDSAGNDSKGCGGVMRVAPVGLMAWTAGWPAEKTFRHGIELAAITHGHPTGTLTGGVLAVLILVLTDGASLHEGLVTAKALLKQEAHHEETLHAIATAEELADSTLPPHEAIAKLGQGWVAEEALAISIYCALIARTFRQGVLLAVNHDGDSDSTGAITGNLLGAMFGVKAIPAAWLAPLELREVIAELAEDLYGYLSWDIGEYSKDTDLHERIWRKYPGW